MANETPDTTVPGEALPEIGQVVDTKLAQELDQQYIREEMARVIADGMRRSGAENDHQEELVVVGLLALTVNGKKLIFLRPELFDIFRRQQQILTTAPQIEKEGRPLG